ncbi:MAG: ABC transporter substrate-binding protein [marine benthic group bacterium]|nr:ABC transporter substrate-binding protein [Gemmatimonadota bacterium]
MDPRLAEGGYDAVRDDAGMEPMGGTAMADSVRAILLDRRWNEAGEFVDSVFSAGISSSDLSAGDAIAMSVLLRSLAEEDRAARLILDHPAALSSPEGVDALRDAARGMSIEELDSLRRALSTVRVPESAAGTVHVEYARALALAGEESESRRIAREVRREALDQPDRDTLEDLRDGRIVPLSGPVRIGAVLSLTGRFSRVGEDLRDGIGLAVDEWNAVAGPSEQIELLVVDDRSEPGAYGELVSSLEADGVSAVIGPIRSSALAEMARLRTAGGLTIVSPTAAWDSAAGPHAFSIWDRGRRERAIGEAVGQWFPERMELFRLAALYPDSEGGRAGFRAFEAAALASGAVITEARTYESDSTTYQQPIEAILESDPEGVFVLADDANTLLQLAPQLSYYGLRSRIVAGGETWSEPEVLRRLEPSYSEFKVIATFLDRSAPGPAWTRFQESYEREFRRPVPENLLPALGYDAARIVTENVSRGALGRPGALTRSILDAGYLDGATGRIRWTRSGLPAREVDVKMVRDRRLVAADPDSISAWAEEARIQEELQKEIEEEEAERKAARQRSQP